MSYEENKKYFELAYRTGSDIWTHKNYRSKVFEYISYIPKGGTVLDLGSGRGVWPFLFVDAGFKVIGIDYIQSIIDANNQEVYFRKIEDRIRFLAADIFDMPFAENAFDVITDFGLVQHLHSEDFKKYREALHKVLKPGGHILNVSFSKNTEQFLSFHPKESGVSNYEAEGLPYYFFGDDEIIDLYGDNMNVINQEHIIIPEHHNEVFVITLLQKN